jgi:dihydroorotase
MTLPDIIKASTWSPAQVIKREEFGHLTPGAVADVAVLSMIQGNFGVRDTRNFKIETKQRLECEMTVKGGRIVFDTNGISVPAFKQ